MDIKYRLYPYPVLSDFSNSYEGVQFKVSPVLSSEGFEIIIQVTVELSDYRLRELIEHGDAIIVYHLECAQTGFREIKKTDQYEYKIVIKNSLISGDLHFCPFIIACKDLKNFYSENFNSKYYNEPVKYIEQGCLLAIGKQVNWKINKSNQDLIHSSSPFRILPNMDESQNHMVVEYENDERIKIKLRKEDYALYKAMKSDPRLKDVFNSIIVVPALIYVLGELKNSSPSEMEENFSRYSWYIAIKESLAKNYKIDINDISTINPFELAQKLLNTPSNSAISNLADLGGGIDSGEEEE